MCARAVTSIVGCLGASLTPSSNRAWDSDTLDQHRLTCPCKSTANEALPQTVEHPESLQLAMNSRRASMRACLRHRANQRTDTGGRGRSAHAALFHAPSARKLLDDDGRGVEPSVRRFGPLVTNGKLTAAGRRILPPTCPSPPRHSVAGIALECSCRVPARSIAPFCPC